MDEEITESGVSPHKLYKSNDDRVIDGVCGGLAEYLGLDATVVRLLLVAFSILSIGAGVIFYIIGMLVIPTKPLSVEGPSETGESKKNSRGGSTVTLVLGIIIVIVGVTLLFDYYDLVPVSIVFRQFGQLALPVIFILIGGALLLGRDKKENRTGNVEGESVVAGVEKKKLA